MSDEPTILHKTYSIALVSYRRKIGWVPKAMVKETSGGTDHTISGDPKHLVPTQEVANKIAEKLAIEWIDAEFPSASG